MELAVVVRLLWRRRLACAVGAVFAIAVALVLGASPSPALGTAKTRVIVDTPQSQLVTDAPHGVDTLYWRATLLGMLLGTDRARQQMAAEMHVPASQIATLDVELGTPSVPASLPNAAVQAAGVTTQPYVVQVQTDDVLPVVSIDTAAPNRAAAARLATAAVHALQTGSSPRDTNMDQGLSIRQVSLVQAKAIPGGSGHAKMAAIAVILFCVWCLALALAPARRQKRIAPRIAAADSAPFQT
jgi:hypothetical protein